MAGPSSTSSVHSHNQEVVNLKALFAQGFDFQTTDCDMINHYTIYKFNDEYAEMNVEDYCLWDSIQMDFAEFEARHFDELNNTTWRVVRDYCYPHEFWIDHNFGPGSNCTTIMLIAVEGDWNNKWSLEQIKWLEERYQSLSRTTRKRKQQLTAIINSDSVSNPETNIQDKRFQTPLQQSATLQPMYPVMTNRSSYIYQPYQQLQQPHQPDQAHHQPAATSFRKPLTVMDVGQYNICNRRNDYQPTRTPVSNSVSYCPTSKIQDNCQCISERSIASTQEAPPAQTSPIQTPQAYVPPTEQVPTKQETSVQIQLVQAAPAEAPPMQALLVQVLPASAPSALNELGYKQSYLPLVQLKIFDASTVRDTEIAGLFEKDVSKIVTLEEFVTPDKVVTPEDVPSSTQVFNSRFVDEIKDPCTDKDTEKNRHIELAYNYKDKNLLLTQSPTIQRPYNVYRDFYIWPPREPISLLGASSDSIVKVVKPLHDVPEASTNCFAIHHPHYKDEQVSNPIRTSVCAANCLYFGYSLSNLSTAPACTAKPGLVMKKGEPPKTLLHLLSHQSLSLLLSSTLSEIRSAIFEYFAMAQYVPVMSEWQFSSTLAVEDCKYLTFTQNLPDASFDLSCAAQTAKSLPDNDTVQLIGYVICVSDSTNNVDIMHLYNQTTRNVLSAEFHAMTCGFGIEKQHGGRYHSVQ